MVVFEIFTMTIPIGECEPCFRPAPWLGGFLASLVSLSVDGRSPKRSDSQERVAAIRVVDSHHVDSRRGPKLVWEIS